ncbi:hypothetical protein C1N83_25535 [Priestia aryabhattai]|uniref:hypothetical protein n=1 Tax=Priestia megaterium TaxID=1404 RepID=UPI000D51382F|nr:hypothetical protein DC428_12985 [Priestia megaterium]PVE80583.1 hypothetical protein DC426_25630 [Priestia megaterium]PVE81987.1 hypothetical protein DC421_17750 [Priestia megaterium]PVE99901.1 hypothetical protein DC433_10585 [Priestia megaterium]
METEKGIYDIFTINGLKEYITRRDMLRNNISAGKIDNNRSNGIWFIMEKDKGWANALEEAFLKKYR